MSATLMTCTEMPARSRAGLAITLFLMTTLIAASAALVRWRLVIPGDASSTADNILSHEPLFQMLFAADMSSICACIAMTLLFHDSLKMSSKLAAWLSTSMSAVACAFAGVSSLLHIAALLLLRGARSLNILTVQAVSDLALNVLMLRQQIYTIGVLFFVADCALTVLLLIRGLRKPA